MLSLVRILGFIILCIVSFWEILKGVLKGCAISFINGFNYQLTF